MFLRLKSENNDESKICYIFHILLVVSFFRWTWPSSWLIFCRVAEKSDSIYQLSAALDLEFFRTFLSFFLENLENLKPGYSLQITNELSKSSNG